MLNIIKGKQKWAREEAWVSSRLSPFQHRDHKTANSPPHCQLATLFTMHFQHYPSTHTSQPRHTTHMLVSTKVWVSTVWAGWVSTAGNITVADPCQPFPRCCRLRGKLSRNWARKAPLKTNQELFLLLTFWINRTTPFGKWKWKWSSTQICKLQTIFFSTKQVWIEVWKVWIRRQLYQLKHFSESYSGIQDQAFLGMPKLLSKPF